MRDDLINRQAAIDFIDAGRLCNPNEPRWSDNEVVNFLKSRPSTQPKIIRCKDCKFAEVADKEDDQDGYTCQFHRGSIWFSGSYCSWAERRTDG